MDPKTAQPTPAAGSSKDQQGATVDEQEPTDAKESITWTTTKEPSGAETYRPTVKWPGRPKEEQLPAFPDISIRQKFRPRVSSEQIMSTVAYFAMFVSYEWYETDGRKLIREDVLGIMCMVFFGSEYKSSKPFYDKFDNPDGDPGIITMQATYAEFAAAWVPQVDIWYQELKKVDSATRARDEALKGFPGRMPHFLTFPAHMPVIAGIRLEGYQVCTHYFILKWGKTRENEDITESIKREIFGHHYGLKKATKKDREIPVSTTLADPNKDVTKQADRIVCRSREYWEFFKGAADKVIEDWEVDVKGMEPRNKDAAASQSNLLSVTTTDFAAMTITATADNPLGLAQHGRDRDMRPTDDPSWKGKGKQTLDFDDYLDPAAYAGSGPEEDPPAPRGDMEQSRGAKRSQRESTSGSREEEGGSRKGKQAVGKKRREKK